MDQSSIESDRRMDQEIELRSRCLLSTAFALLAGSLASYGQPAGSGEAPTYFGRRFDGFRLLFHDAGHPLGTLEELRDADPEEWDRWIVVVLGDPRPLDRMGLDLGRFVRDGGSLFVATDRPTTELLRGFGCLIRPGPLTAPYGPNYEDRPACPIASPLDPAHPLFAGIRGFVTNLPGSVVSPEDWSLAWLPSVTKDGRLLPGTPLVLAGRELARGRILLLADHSVLINEMILEMDDANLIFASNIVDWLTAGREPGQTRVLFIEERQDVETWIDPRFETAEWSDFGIGEVLNLLNEVIEGVEEEDRRSRRSLVDSLVAHGEDGLHPSLLRGAVLLLPVGVLLALLLRWSRRAADRERELDREGAQRSAEDWREAGRLAAREFLVDTFGSVEAARDEKGKPRTPLITGSRSLRREVRQTLARIYELAEGRDTGLWKPSRYAHTQRDLVGARSWVERKTVRWKDLAVPPAPVSPRETRWTR